MSNSEFNYEKAIKRLEEIVSLLDKNEASLEESMKLFEEGTKLSSYCNKTLTEAKQKIIEISKD